MGLLKNWRPVVKPLAADPRLVEAPASPIKAVIRARSEAAREIASPATYAEIRRIMGMPVMEPLSPEEHDSVCGEVELASEYDGGWRLFEPQSNGLVAYRVTGGLFGPIGVGWGKQLLCNMIAQEASDKGIQRILMLVPAQVYGQAWDVQIPWSRRKVRLTVPFFGLGRKSPAARLAIAKSGRRGCYIMPYSCLSVKNTSDVLEALKPQLIIADEADNLRNRTAARTKRVLDYCKEAKPEFCALSGTITRTKIRDYWHLLKLCLKENSPLPLTAQLADEWSMVLDSDAAPTNAQTGPIRPLVDWARKNFTACRPCNGSGFVGGDAHHDATGTGYVVTPGVPAEKCDECKGTGRIAFTEDVAGFRRAYKYRLISSPGVHATSDNEIGCSLFLANAPVQDHEECDGFGRLRELIDQVEGAWLTPNMDEIEHAIHKYKWLFELSAGFYNELTWPDEKKLEERGIPAVRLEASKQWHALSQQYARELREWLEEHSFAGCDTPLLVASYMAQKGAPPHGAAMHDAWQDMHAADFDGRIERDGRAVRVCDYKIKHALEWAKQLPKGEGGIVWYFHQEVGRWLADEFHAAGINYLHAPAGEEHNENIIETANADKVVLASLKAHGVGKNLQHFQHQIFVQWLRDASKAEQALGRTHRNGQLADLLVVVTTNTLEFDKCNFAACLNDALYISQTTGVRQKLIYCGYDPQPEIFPSEVLKERGFQNKLLTAEQRKLMLDKFRPEQA